MLRDLERPVRTRFDDRVPHVGEVGNALPVDEAVAAAALGAALDRVTRHGAGGEQVPGIGTPVEGVDHRREREAGVGDAARDDDVRAAAQRIDHGPGPEVGVGREHPIAYVGERPARIEVSQVVPPGQEAVQPPQQIVPRHDPDAQPAFELEAARDVGDGLGAGARVHTARVGRDLDAPLDDDRQDALHQRHEVLGVTERLVARLLLLQDGHGHFGQVVHHEIVDRPARHLAVRRFEPVAPEPLPGGDPHGARAPRRRHGTGSRRTCCPVESKSVTPKSVKAPHCSRAISTSTVAWLAQSGKRTVTLSAGAPRPLTATDRSAPMSTVVARPAAAGGPEVDASTPAVAGTITQGASAPRTVAVTPESGGATTSRSYAPATRSSADTTKRAVPGSVPPSETTESWPTPRNGAPFGSNR